MNIRKGIKLLNTLDSNWEKKVNPKTLCMASPSHCILAQVYGNYNRGLETIARHLGYEHYLPLKKEIELGFAPEDCSDYGKLEKIWKKYLKRNS